jgi:hypothetical protein
MKILALIWLTCIGIDIPNRPNPGINFRVLNMVSFVVLVGSFLLYWGMQRGYKTEKNELEALRDALPKESI